MDNGLKPYLEPYITLESKERPGGIDSQRSVTGVVYIGQGL